MTKQPERWPLKMMDCTGFKTRMEVNPSGDIPKAGKVWFRITKTDRDDVPRDFSPNDADMDRLFVTWAAERGINLHAIWKALPQIQPMAKGRGTTKLDSASADWEAAQSETHLRAVLDNAKVSP